MRLSSIALGALALASLSACSTSGTVTGTETSSVDDTYTTSSMSDTSMTDTSSTMSAPADTSTTSMAANSKTAWDGKYLTGKHTVVLKTSKGDITLELDADVAPKTVTNFVTLAKDGYYNNLTFHRVIPGFMIQGGDPDGRGTGGESIYGDTFADEIDASSDLYQKVGYKKGVIAMANRGPNTNGSQFFIMETDYPLPPSYTIFGHVTSGQDVVSAIAAVPRGANDMPNTPVTFTPVVKN